MCNLTAAAKRSLPADNYAPRLARQFLRAHLCPHAAEVLDEAELLVSEVVTNAVSYAGPPVGIALECITDAMIVKVHDGAHTMHAPVRGALNEDERLADGEIDLDEHGRGLGFVDLLSARIDITPDESGKTVIFELALS